jgi:hypothetical protein
MRAMILEITHNKTMEDMNQIQVEIEKHKYFMNMIVGVLSFTFALACLSLGNSEFFGKISLFFIFLLSIYAKFPLAIKNARNKKDPTKQEKEILDTYNKYYSIVSLLKTTPIYLTGVIFLTLVSLGLIDSNGALFFNIIQGAYAGTITHRE